MNEELKDMLCEYLGELMHNRDTTFDWIEKDKIIEKINAINVLLEVNHKEETLGDRLMQAVDLFNKKI